MMLIFMDRMLSIML